MSKKYLSIFLLFALLFGLSSEACKQNTNKCLKCNPLTDLCAQCESRIYKPDEIGGCEPAKQCILGQNYCLECNEEQDKCSKCELSFFPDENGGCSFTDNCVISDKGTCIQCKEDFHLIYTNITSVNIYTFCKYKHSDEFKNCEEPDYQNLKCLKCEEGFFLSSDNRCVETEHCQKSIIGVCADCQLGYYLDKTDDVCNVAKGKLTHCALSLDGEICDECKEGYKLSGDGICVITKNCLKGNEKGECEECKEGFYFTKIGNVCTSEKNCYRASYDFNLCELCMDDYYLEMETRKCKSSEDDDELKYCTKVSNGECISCISEYILGPDSRCSSSNHCLESARGKCTKCEDNFFLGKDKRCTDIEKCMYSTLYGDCLECDQYYYYNIYDKKCYPALNQYIDCKRASGQICSKCKDDFYLSYADNLCHSNKNEGPFYKCDRSQDGQHCSECIEGYYLGSEDKKCSKVENCAISKDENTCSSCTEDYCLDLKKKECVDNFWGPEDDNSKIYFSCNITNEEGTECAQCKNDKFELVDGLCINSEDCEKEEDGECVKCHEADEDGYLLCLNKVFGCVETGRDHCLRCDDIFDFSKCDECAEGYELDDDGICIEA